jgi:hypothetical protein
LLMTRSNALPMEPNKAILAQYLKLSLRVVIILCPPGRLGRQDSCQLSVQIVLFIPTDLTRGLAFEGRHALLEVSYGPFEPSGTSGRS